MNTWSHNNERVYVTLKNKIMGCWWIGPSYSKGLIFCLVADLQIYSPWSTWTVLFNVLVITSEDDISEFRLFEISTFRNSRITNKIDIPIKEYWFPFRNSFGNSTFPNTHSCYPCLTVLTKGDQRLPLDGENEQAIFGEYTPHQKHFLMF